MKLCAAQSLLFCADDACLSVYREEDNAEKRN